MRIMNQYIILSDCCLLGFSENDLQAMEISYYDSLQATGPVYESNSTPLC